MTSPETAADKPSAASTRNPETNHAANCSRFLVLEDDKHCLVSIKDFVLVSNMGPFTEICNKTGDHC